MKFNRHIPFSGYTLAWRLFKRHHTHFNDIYWAHHAALRYTYAATRHFQRSDLTTKLFSIPTNPHRLATKLGTWADNYSDFNAWTQMAAVIAISGYLETYLAQIATAAIESCPALIFGGKAEIDGVSLLKARNKYDFYIHAEPLVRGDWQSRINSYARLFGTCPYSGELSQLERLRTLRNNAGHSFGRDIKMMRLSESSIVQPLPKISDKNIQEFLELANTVAAATEKHLSHAFVGSYEVVRLFHTWNHSLNPKPLTNNDLAIKFSRYFNTVTGNTYGKERAIQLINYYKAA